MTKNLFATTVLIALLITGAFTVSSSVIVPTIVMADKADLIVEFSHE
jgi:hypothetical protein